MKSHFLTIPYQSISQLPAISKECIEFLDNNQSLTLDEITNSFFSAFHTAKNKIIVSIDEGNNEVLNKLRCIEEGNYSSVSIYPEFNTVERKKKAFLFTGGGSQYPKMGKELYDNETVFREAIDRCAEIAMNYLEHDIRKVMFSGKTTKKGKLINRIDYMQMALFSYEYAMFSLWSSTGVKPDIVIGHSIGEIIASCVAGIFSLEDAIKLTCLSGQLVENYTKKGQMAVVQGEENVVRGFIKDYKTTIGIAVINSPLQTVISGELNNLKKVLNDLNKSGFETKILKISHAFHSPLMIPALEPYISLIKSIKIKTPSIKMVSCITGEEVDSKVLSIEYWIGHLINPVKFSKGFKKIKTYDIDTFIEVGPNPVLLGIIDEHPDFEADILQISSADMDEPCKFYNSIKKWIVEGGSVDDTSIYKDVIIDIEKFEDFFNNLSKIINTTESNENDALEVNCIKNNVQVRSIVKEEIGSILSIVDLENLPIQKPLKELGLNSIKALKLVKNLSKILHQNITVSNLFDYPTVTSLANFIVSDVNKKTVNVSRIQDKNTDSNVKQYIDEINNMSLDELELELEKELDLLGL
ncbi:acyltransferase domain-containing protein [Aquimarina sp. ERC-38]|uniref:acyltransferase domain-containing protein n=1 Tax=Aquimarina sp. ERC-38 TaxID=2949996 RepID=UPI002247FCFB|nr:acyltransferase domain-containing protein [Aquimarina sp. ERC-38]UZO79158.1 acyltransferase domain-containing protein [Aquimarina sp. ERC-38]